MKIHSVESFGTVDGPGVRYIIFAQGCPLRCLYCHNPDTWHMKDAAEDKTPEELMADVVKYRSYIKSGGLTVSGGEPLMQVSEVKRLFALSKKEGIHTTLDTAGVLLNDEVKELLKVTDLVMLDIKAIDPDQFTTITGGGKLSKSIEFLNYLESEGVPTWIRHVVVPGYTDNEELLQQLAEKLKEYTVIEKVELLPYHVLSRHKYEGLGLEYPLGETEPCTKSRIAELQPIFAEIGKK